MKEQVNLTMSDIWKKELQKIARLKSVEEEKIVTYLDLIRGAVKEKYNLPDED